MAKTMFINQRVFWLVLHSWRRCLKPTLTALWDHSATVVVASTSSLRKFSAATANNSVLFHVIQSTIIIRIGLWSFCLFVT